MNWIQLATKHECSVLITLLEVQGSAPRDAACKMLVWVDGQVGTIGGGELEYRLVKRAKQMLDDAIEQPLLTDFPLGPVLGQCCGGFVRAMLEPIQSSQIKLWQQAVKTGRAVQIRLPDGKKTLIDADATKPAITLLDNKNQQQEILAPISEIGFVLEQPAPKQPIIYIFGGGHIGAALHHILCELDVDIRWFDTRKNFAPPAVFCDDLVRMAKCAPQQSKFVVLTHSHKLDYDLCLAILSCSDIAYCGLIGSATKRARFVQRLAKDGITEQQIGRLTCPAGLPGIGGKDPAEIAIAISAQLLEQEKRLCDGN